jgi:hypothetical protein
MARNTVKIKIDSEGIAETRADVVALRTEVEKTALAIMSLQSVITIASHQVEGFAALLSAVAGQIQTLGDVMVDFPDLPDLAAAAGEPEAKDGE